MSSMLLDDVCIWCNEHIICDPSQGNRLWWHIAFPAERDWSFQDQQNHIPESRRDGRSYLGRVLCFPTEDLTATPTPVRIKEHGLALRR